MQDKAARGSRSDADILVSGLLVASRALVGVAARSLTEVEGVVTLAQFRSLVVLSSHGEIKLGRLAELLDVNASTAQRMVDRLVTADLVARNANPESRREVLVALTQEGQRVVDAVTRRRRREISAIVRRMPAGQRTAAADALRAFAAAAGEPEHPSGSLWGWSTETG